ncbi:MAG: HNH endonuclease [Ichthyobacteriaceae bacterium]|nr:HNH endonuclease [Ichthyobacteriaceae bacterium]
MPQFTESKINAVWNSARTIQGKNKDRFRLDIAGAIIERSKYGFATKFGWEVDHIYPVSKGGTNIIDNLQALQHDNNRSKGNDFPRFNIVLESNYYLTDNIYVNKISKIPLDKVRELRLLYRVLV